ncbi:transketolase C-terminal domain-containing protein, partial [bacterium]
KQDTSDAHGAPLGEDEILATKKNIGWKYKKKFFVPKEVYDLFKERNKQLKAQHRKWNRELRSWEKENPQLARTRTSMLEKNIPRTLESRLMKVLPDKPAATRAISGAVLQEAAKIMPGLTGGSADLAPSNKTYIKDSEPVSAVDFSGRNFHFGIREHAMGAALNGMALYGGWIPYGGTFLVFSDYMKTPIRLSALMEQQVIYVFTHDSFYVGEDGPTHQPIEHLTMLRSIPNVHLFRPADGVETAIAWACAIRRTDGPTILSLTRQGVPKLKRPNGFMTDAVKRGGYVLADAAGGKPDMTIVAAGSEVGLAVDTKKLLGKYGKSIRIVSIPCMEIFDAQPESYRKKVIPPGCEKLVAMEAGSAMSWYKYVGKDGLVISLDHFGESAPGTKLADHFGFTPKKATARIKDFFSL